MENIKDPKIAIPIVLLAGILWSFGPYVVRHIDQAETVPWQYLFTRGIVIFVILNVYLFFEEGINFYKNYLKVGISGTIGGIGLGTAMITFIWSITNTSAAVTLLCLAAMPFITALLGFLFLKEKISLNVWAAIIMAALGIIIMAFANKFDFNKSGMGRTGLIIAIGMAMLIIGAISLSPPDSHDTGIHLIDDEKAKTCSTQERLGTILLGFGLGILIPALIKLFVSSKNKAGDTESMKRNNELAVAFGTFILSLFATIVGSWSWNNFNNCKYSKSNVSSGFNGFATIIAALLTVYCVVFGILRARNNVVADYMSNFSKSKEFVMKKTASK